MDSFKDIITKTAKEMLGPEARVHQVWFDENYGSIQSDQNHQSSVSTRNKKCQTEGQFDLQEMQD